MSQICPRCDEDSLIALVSSLIAFDELRTRTMQCIRGMSKQDGAEANSCLSVDSEFGGDKLYGLKKYKKV